MEACFAALKRVFGPGEPLAKTLVGLVTRIAAKTSACNAYGSSYANRPLSRPRGHVEGSWAWRDPRNTHPAAAAQGPP